jgi:hypothetical protein
MLKKPALKLLLNTLSQKLIDVRDFARIILIMDLRGVSIPE